MKKALLLFVLSLQIAFSSQAQNPDAFRKILDLTGNPAQFLDIAATTDTAFVAVGKTGNTLEFSRFLMAKVELDGTPVWAKTFDLSTATDEFIQILPLSNGEFVVVGRSFDANVAGSGAAIAGKFNSLGESQWIRLFDDPNNLVSVSLEDICFHFDPDYLVAAGRYNSLDWVVKLGMDGQVLGQQVFNPAVADTRFVSSSISILDNEYYLKRSFTTNLQSGTIFYKINSALGLESSKAIVTPASNPLTIYETNIFGSDIIFSGDIGAPNQKAAVFGAVKYSNEKVKGNQFTFPDGFKSQWANSFYNHPTKGIEYMMAGTVATSTESKAYTLFLNGYNFSVNKANWSTGNSRIQAYGISENIDNDYAICGVVETGSGNNSFRATITRTEGTDAFACGEECTVDTASLVLTFAPFTTTESAATFQSHALISPTVTNISSWTETCSLTKTKEKIAESAGLLYPNPTSGTCTIHLPHFIPGDRLQILNILGQAVHSSRIDRLESELDLSHLPAGIYSVRVENGGEFSEQKLVKY